MDKMELTTNRPRTAGDRKSSPSSLLIQRTQEREE